MYQALFEIHRGLAIIGCITTVAWAIAALWPILRHQPPQRRIWKPLYSAAAATVGLAGVFGIILAWMGGWITFFFPWIGFVGVWVHGVAGVRGRRAMAAGATGTLAACLFIQVAILIGLYGLMTVKPF